MGSSDALGVALFGAGCLLALGARALPASGWVAVLLAAAPYAGLALATSGCT